MSPLDNRATASSTGMSNRLREFCPLLEDLHVPGFFDQAGHFALLHGGKPSVLAWQNFTGVGGVLGQSIAVHKGVVLWVFTLGRGV